MSEWTPKVGDRVRVAGGLRRMVGALGTVVEIWQRPSRPFRVRVDGLPDDLYVPFNADDLEPVEE